MKLYSSGEAATLLGVHRDKVSWALTSGGPRPSIRLGNRNAFTQKDIFALRDWFQMKGIAVTVPQFDPISQPTT